MQTTRRTIFFVTSLAVLLGAACMKAKAEEMLYPDIFPPLPWTFKAEQEKVDFVARVISKARKIEDGPHSMKPASVCSDLLSAFRNGGDGITAIEPEIRAKSKEDPRIMAVARRCPKLHLFHEFMFDQGWSMDDIRKMSYEEMLENGHLHIVTGQVLYYRLGKIGKMDNVGAIYGERVCRPDEPNNCMRAGYSFFDSNKCREGGGISTPDPYDYFNKKYGPYVSALIEANGTSFVMSFTGPVQGYLQGHLWITEANSIARKSKYFSACSYVTFFKGGGK